MPPTGALGGASDTQSTLLLPGSRLTWVCLGYCILLMKSEAVLRAAFLSSMLACLPAGGWRVRDPCSVLRPNVQWSRESSSQISPLIFLKLWTAKARHPPEVTTPRAPVSSGGRWWGWSWLMTATTATTADNLLSTYFVLRNTHRFFYLIHMMTLCDKDHYYLVLISI